MPDHPLKMAMLVISTIWFVACVFGFGFGYFTSLDDGYELGSTGVRMIGMDSYNAAEFQIRAVGQGVFVCIAATALYVPVMIVLAVAWFSTKPTR